MSHYNFLHVFKNNNPEWNSAVSKLKKIMNGVTNFTLDEKYNIIKYDGQFKIITINNFGLPFESTDPEFDYDNTYEYFNDESKFIELFGPIFTQYLKGIKKLSGQQNFSNKVVYFLVRGVSSEIKQGVAEGWHHDYMWAPASYSSIIYLTAGDDKLTTANFCKWEFNKSEKRKFGTDTYGPGIGSIFKREEIYEKYYKNFLQKYKENDYIDFDFGQNVPNIKYAHKIAIRLSNNKVVKAVIVRFDKYRDVEYIYFTLSKYYKYTEEYIDYIMNKEDKLNEFLYGKGDDGSISLSAYNISSKEKKLFSDFKDKTVYKVKFSDWDRNWKLTLFNLNPGSIGYNLLVGPDIYLKLLESVTEYEKQSLLHKYFGEPLYNEYIKKHSSEMSGCPNDKYIEKINDLELYEGLMWDNKNTWHRSPFVPKDSLPMTEKKRIFLNIRMVVVDKNVIAPFDVENKDFSQLQGGFYKKYLKYKLKYLNLKKTIRHLKHQ